MIGRVLTSFLGEDTSQHRVVAVVRGGFPLLYGIQNVYLDHVTDGAARSVILGIHGAGLPLNDPLLIVNSDQIVDFDLTQFLAGAGDASMVVFPVHGGEPRWSYARIEWGYITKVAEKQAISEWATAGVYYWRRTYDFVRSAGRMISLDDRVNNEFYVAPTYNYALAEGMLVTPFFVEESQFHDLGTPAALEEYLGRR